MDIRQVEWSQAVADILSASVEYDPYLLAQLESLAAQENALVFGALEGPHLKAAMLMTVQGAEANMRALAAVKGVSVLADCFPIFETACEQAGMQSVIVETFRPGLAHFLLTNGYSAAFVTYRKRFDHGLKIQ